jgi:hypothetical protein
MSVRAWPLIQRQIETTGCGLRGAVSARRISVRCRSLMQARAESAAGGREHPARNLRRRASSDDVAADVRRCATTTSSTMCAAGARRNVRGCCGKKAGNGAGATAKLRDEVGRRRRRAACRISGRPGDARAGRSRDGWRPEKSAREDRRGPRGRCWVEFSALGDERAAAATVDWTTAAADSGVHTQMLLLLRACAGPARIDI